MIREPKQKLLVLVGPTAVGKTKLSLNIALEHQCEIISGDSMQVYRGMDIGTAKASMAERQTVPHHLIDICEPDEPFSAADFQQRARQQIADIASRGRLPFIVGGTGLYIESVCYDYQFSEGGADESFREELRQRAERLGTEVLHHQLAEIDPVSAAKIHPNDMRRTMRALEVHHLTGKPMSEHLQGQAKEPVYDICLIGLTMDRVLLYKRIEERIDAMIDAGLLAEVAALLARGYHVQLVSMQGLGYKEIAACMQGRYTREEAVELLKRNTKRFAKRQLSWFRHMEQLQWVDVTDSANLSSQLEQINGIITGRFPRND